MRLPVPRRPALLLLAAALACGGGTPASRPTAAAFAPDVPAWRGGCFYEGAPGKIVNGTPGPEVLLYGDACQGGAGGLVYLDAYDPIAGTGTVTVLPSAAGSRPVAVAPAGGAGGIVAGSAGARLDPAQRKLLTLRGVSFVTGELVQVDLAHPDAAPAAIAKTVRVLNYDWLPSGAVVFLGNYSASTREGDVFVWRGGAPLRVLAGASRAEFQVYQLDPSRTRAACLTGWTESGGGKLVLVNVDVEPLGLVIPIDDAVERAAWTSGGALVWSARQADGSAALRALTPGAGSARELDRGVERWVVAGDDAGWVRRIARPDGSTPDPIFLTGLGSFLRARVAAGSVELGSPTASLDIGAAPGAARAGMAWVETGADRRTGMLWVAGDAAPRAVEPGVVPRAGYVFSPGATHVAYARGFDDPFAPGSASPQPGVAEEVRVVPLAGGAPFTVARNGPMLGIAWDARASAVAALAGYDAAANAGRLEVRDLASPASPRLSADRVPPTGFTFGDDGAVAAVRGWDDALGRGELVVWPAGASGAPSVAAPDVASFQAPRGGRVLYQVRGGGGGGRDGLWLH